MLMKLGSIRPTGLQWRKSTRKRLARWWMRQTLAKPQPCERTATMETNLLSKYRPRKLAEVLGQPGVIRALRLYVKKPYPAAMLFHGQSGTGKTATACALAHELGRAVHEAAFGGVHEIPPGETGADEVRRVLRLFHLRPMFGSGWKVLICNEADRMTTSAETIWLDALEHLPDKATIVFTTNEPERLQKRFRDRCEVYGFESDSAKLAPAIRRLAKRVWHREGCRGSPPRLDTLGMPTLGDPDAMHASFRLAMQQLTRLVREAKLGGGNGAELRQAGQQIQRDLAILEKHLDVEAACDFCGKTQDVENDCTSFVCEACGKRNHVE